MLIASNALAQVYLLKNLKKGTLGISRGEILMPNALISPFIGIKRTASKLEKSASFAIKPL
jgi:hypothetical protein